MGTASLIVGAGFVLIGLGIIAQAMFGTYWTYDQMAGEIILNLIIGIPLIAIGAYFLKRYDKDKKKSIHLNAPEKLEEGEEKMSGSERNKTIIAVVIISIILFGLILLYDMSAIT